PRHPSQPKKTPSFARKNFTLLIFDIRLSNVAELKRSAAPTFQDDFASKTFALISPIRPNTARKPTNFLQKVHRVRLVCKKIITFVL
ncbi:MAG: hypothetical protein IKK27_04065, partial [Alistipes sp.]|nr:hypothetical protein [Alistipes sp.]